MTTLRVFYWDHLSDSVSSLEGVGKNDILFFAEVKELTSNIPHHKKKLAFLLSAQRHFATSYQEKGHTVHYTKFNDPHNTHTMKQEVHRYINEHKNISKIVVTEPSEHDLLQDVKTWEKDLKIDVEIRTDSRFISTKQDFKKWAEGRNLLIMEYFYREMRKSTGLLMDGKDHLGDQWNLDKQNRKPLKDKSILPPVKNYAQDGITKEVFNLVDKEFPNHFGNLEGFNYGVTKTQAENALDHFCKYALPHFGDYQDAMLSDEPYMVHSLLSPYINAGLLDPLKACKRVEQEYKSGNVPLNAAEGFIRQIIGWREFIRGLYWLKMPQYRKANELDTKKPLPQFYWDGKTDMNCLRQVVTMTMDTAYSHHIQRLMITGNFALLAGLSAHKVHEWYLAVYADAYEWVELPNTLGMTLYADGGMVATKPYAASGSYINRMSDFCKDCKYNVKDKFKEDACPFNYLYWDFLARHRNKFKHNRRMAFAYKTLDRFSNKDVEAIRSNAQKFLKNLS